MLWQKEGNLWNAHAASIMHTSLVYRYRFTPVLVPKSAQIVGGGYSCSTASQDPSFTDVERRGDEVTIKRQVYDW